MIKRNAKHDGESGSAENSQPLLEKRPTRDVIVIGGSAGSLPALQELLANVPADLNAAIFVVTHFPGHGDSFLARVLESAGPLPAKRAEDGEPIRTGQIYVAVPDRHLLVKSDHLRLVRGPKENRFRPAVDPLFRSAAVAHGPRAVGVVLSGALDDGTAGLSAIKSCGGIAIAQDPDEASFPGMPASACQHVRVDYVETAHHIGALIAELAQQPVNLAAAPNVPDVVKFELAITEQTMNGMEANNQIGRPTVLSCPDCNGVLWEVQGSDIVRFRCHVGHSYTADAMMLSQSESLERALWAAVAALQQRAKLCEAMLAKARERDWKFSIEDLEEKAKEARDHVDVLRKVLLRGREFTAAETAAEQNADHLDDSHQEVRAGEREIVQELHRARPNRR